MNESTQSQLLYREKHSNLVNVTPNLGRYGHKKHLDTVLHMFGGIRLFTECTEHVSLEPLTNCTDKKCFVKTTQRCV